MNPLVEKATIWRITDDGSDIDTVDADMQGIAWIITTRTPYLHRQISRCCRNTDRLFDAAGDTSGNSANQDAPNPCVPKSPRIRATIAWATKRKFLDSAKG